MTQDVGQKQPHVVVLADDGLYIIEVEQLIGVDADRGNTHAMALDRHAFALIGAGVAQHAAHLVIERGVFQIAFSHQLGAQGVAGHNHGGCNLAILGADVRSRCFVCHNSIFH